MHILISYGKNDTPYLNTSSQSITQFSKTEGVNWFYHLYTLTCHKTADKPSYLKAVFRKSSFI